MGRGGQVFYLYNRVETIEQKVEEIQERCSGSADRLCSWTNDRGAIRKYAL